LTGYILRLPRDAKDAHAAPFLGNRGSCRYLRENLRQDK
jgi:hypothetical protein